MFMQQQESHLESPILKRWKELTVNVPALTKIVELSDLPDLTVQVHDHSGGHVESVEGVDPGSANMEYVRVSSDTDCMHRADLIRYGSGPRAIVRVTVNLDGLRIEYGIQSRSIQHAGR